MTCKKCGKNTKISHKCIDDIVYAPENIIVKMSESDKLLETFEKALHKTPYLLFEIKYTNSLKWEICILNDSDHRAWERKTLAYASCNTIEEACKLAIEQLEKFL